MNCYFMVKCSQIYNFFHLNVTSHVIRLEKRALLFHNFLLDIPVVNINVFRNIYLIFCMAW